ncbi:AfsR/SARP family transcriptional regulator [Nonomuraea sp. PA05]|uniref:AfsR/SARP family transcriptional regulator n=1 Tax=Nonomuraea sp. PA05 TaxID=2604466 RepID=UPI0016524EDA|nr:AfsR/SARP family transcriptional regulator [Nonomuraea sp. PA05]
MKIRLLGPLQVARSDGWATIRAPQQRAVLAVLLLANGSLVTIDRLIDELWGERPPASAHNTIHAYVMRLRRVLTGELGHRLITRPPGYQFQVETQALDCGVFERLLTEGQADLAAGRWEPASERLTQGLALWHGSAALADVPSTPAVEAERARLDRFRLTALEAGIDANLELGRHAEVLPELERLAAEYPLRENLRRLLMLALYRCGRRTDALEVYRETRRLFIDELGIEPAKELRDLEHTILRDERPLGTAPGSRGPARLRDNPRDPARLRDDSRDPARLRDNPRDPARLRDDSRDPARLRDEQPAAPDTTPRTRPAGTGPVEAGPVGAGLVGAGPVGAGLVGAGLVGAGPPCMLPPDIADFTGREEQVRQLMARLARDDETTAPAVTALCGHGGIGKTALAVHVAHRLRTRFPGGQLYVDLHGAEQDPADPGEVLARFLTALGADGRALPTSTEERAERYRGLLAHSRLLVVLDNAASERQIRPLLPGSPSCAVIVTSRRRLRWISSQPLHLDVLESGSARQLLTRIVGAERPAGAPEAAETIVRLCGYLPLAIRVAGGRLAARPHWPLERMATRLLDERQRLDELSEDDMAVRASLELSYAALEPGSRFFFRSLGLLDVPDFAAWLPAAMLDIAVEQAETHLDSLLDAQLLTWAGTDGLGQNRYRLHDLVRLYARERAEHEDPAEVHAQLRTRALGAWLALAETADQLLSERVAADIYGSAHRWPPDPAIVRAVQADPTAWFDSERAALPTLIAQAGAAGLDDTAWELAATAINYFAFRGLYHSWLQTHELARQVCAQSGNRRGEAVMLRNLGYLRMTGVKATPRIILVGAESALETFRQTDDLHGQIDAQFLCGVALRHKGDFGQAHAHATEAMAAAITAAYELGQGRLWYLRAMIAREQGRPDAAGYAELSFKLAERSGAIHDRVLALWELAAAPADTGAARQQTLERVHDHIDVCRRRSERLLEAYLLLCAGNLDRALRRADARDEIERALKVFETYAVPLGRTVGLRLLGELDHAAGEYAHACGYLHDAAEIGRQTNNTYEQALALKALEAAWHARGDRDAARQAREEALALFRKLNNLREVVEITGLIR